MEKGKSILICPQIYEFVCILIHTDRCTQLQILIHIYRFVDTFQNLNAHLQICVHIYTFVYTLKLKLAATHLKMSVHICRFV